MVLGLEFPLRLSLSPRTKVLDLTVWKTDSPLEEDGFELAVPLREGKGCGQPLRQALPFRA
jgi:hypothetical protein